MYFVDFILLNVIFVIVVIVVIVVCIYVSTFVSSNPAIARCTQYNIM